MVKVKICGITNLEDALACFFYRADAVGFVFYKKSPRCISLSKARQISRILPNRMLKVGVFVDEGEKRIKKVACACGLNMLQFHGEESPAFCRRFKEYKIIKAFKVNDEFDFSSLKNYASVYAFLFDSYSRSKKGGTGKNFDWNLFKCRAKIKKPIFLSGGLSFKNVQAALRIIKPDWVDVSSSIETSPGKKSHRKILRFIKEIK